MRLAKHHGLGNDFLVLVHPAGEPCLAASASLAVAVCDRHEGIGADGLLEAFPAPDRPDGADLAMVLHNADGSIGAMSGNGIRCLVHAAVLAGAVEGPVVAVATDVGVRTVEVLDAPAGPRWSLRADLGRVVVSGPAPEWCGNGVADAVWVDAGNPHLVLLGGEDAAALDVSVLGEAANEAVPGGVNVELVCPGARPGELYLTVYERGVGPTLACGTGAGAAAVAWRARRGGPELIEVAMPGGRAQVGLGATVSLRGPSVAVATIELDLDAVGGACR